MKRTLGAIKAVGKNRVGGYLVVWGSPEQRDLQGEYFTSDTDFQLDLYSTRPALYHHGLDGGLKSMKVGEIDTLDPDDVGLWAEAQIEAHNEYIKMVLELVEKDVLSWSSGSLSHLVEVTKGGWIKAWPLVEGSLTPSPAEPRNTEITTLKHHIEIELLEKLTATKANNDSDDDGNTEPDNPALDANTKTGESIVEITEEQRQVLADLLQALLGESGMEASEEDMAAMAAEMEGKAEDELPEEDEEEDEPAKSLKLADFEKLVNERLHLIIPDAIKAHVEKKELAKKTAAASALQAISGVQAGVAAPTLKTKVGGVRESNTARIQVTDEDDMRFANASWQDMALYVKVKSAMEVSKLPEFMRKDVTLGQIVSPGFAANMAHKMAYALEQNPFTDPVSRLRVKSFAPFLKANELDATNLTNQGLEWVGTTFDDAVWQRARHELRLFDLLSSKGLRIKDVDPGTNKVTFAIDTGSGTVYTRGEANSVGSDGRPESTVQVQPFTTDSVTMTAKEHAIAVIPTDWLTEDTFVDVARFLNEDMMQTLLESLESVLINGDTETAASTNINLIDDTPATGLQTPDYIAWDGMRQNFLIENTGQGRDNGGGLAITDYMTTRAKFGTTIRNRKANMLTIIDFDTEVATRKVVQLLTADVAGGSALATMYTGDLPQVLDGVDTYTSGLLAKTNASGMISATAGNNTKGTIIVAYAPYIAYGRKRAVEIKQAEDIYAGTVTWVASIRHTSVHRSADGSVGSYNVGV